jgi:hypothetical protein
MSPEITTAFIASILLKIPLSKGDTKGYIRVNTIKEFGKRLLCEKAEKKNKPLLSETIKI